MPATAPAQPVWTRAQAQAFLPCVCACVHKSDPAATVNIQQYRPAAASATFATAAVAVAATAAAATAAAAVVAVVTAAAIAAALAISTAAMPAE